MSATISHRTMLDGRNASAYDLAPLAFSGFAHFTAMQVRSGCVQGLDLHLNRLKTASEKMFGQAHANAEILAYLRSAINGGPADVSLTATIFSRNGEFSARASENDLGILVRTAAPSNGPVGPLRLETVMHNRPLASLKHVGEATKTYYLRRAVERGFDDAVYIDSDGRLSEATIWNLAFWDGQSVIWPEADMLNGITMQIVSRQLTAIGIQQRRETITLDTVKLFSGGAVMNSWTPGVAISAIASTLLGNSDNLVEILHRAYLRETPTTI